jgi:exonuclease III
MVGVLHAGVIDFVPTDRSVPTRLAARNENNSSALRSKAGVSIFKRPATLAGFSINIGRGFLPESRGRKKNDRGKASQVNERMQDNDFACVQETGVSGDITPASLEEVFKNCTVCLHGPEDSSNSHPHNSLAIIVKDSWSIGAVLRGGAGRCMAVAISQGSWKCLIVSVLMPTGLDQIPGCSSTAKRLEAQRVADTVYRWTREYREFVVMGDFNETRNPDVDRSPALKRRFTDRNTINTMVDSLKVVDLYRELHPAVPGFTRVQGKGGPESRIDHILVPRRWYGWGANVWCSTVDVFHDFADHHVLRVRLEGDETIPLCSGGRARPWRQRLPRTSATNQHRRRLCAKACEEFSARKLRKFAAESESWSEEQFNRETAEYLWGVREQAIGTLGLATSRECRPNKEITEAGHKITAIKGLQRALGKVKAGKVKSDSRGVTKAIEKLRKWGLLPVQVMTKELWESWLTGDSDALLATIYKERDVLWAVQREASKARRQTRFSDPKSKGKHYELMFKTAQNASVDSTINDRGELITEPKTYKALVASQVGEIFSREVDEPADFDGTESPRVEGCKVTNTDMKPEWWSKMFSREAKAIPAEMFADILVPATEAEILETVMGAGGGKSAGSDGVSIDLLKLLVTPNCPAGGGTCARPYTATLKVVTLLINEGFRRGHVAPCLKFGRITLLPKVGKDGSFSRVPTEMRPITVLPELGKVANRVISERLGKTLLEHPSILSSSQRAFLKNGAVTQCSNVLVDALEDWNENKRARGGQFYLVSYDQRKAYDCVQKFTIRAALTRFNMPDNLIEYVLSGLTGARSCVKTRDGPTPSFPIKTSVRQGDPLAPLLFVLVSDALHCGMRKHPVTGVEGSGYTFSNDAGCQLVSCGYADDTLVVAESEIEIRRQHDWLCEFYGANGWTLNCTKTAFSVGGRDIRSVSKLRDIDGTPSIKPTKSSAVFKYLGLLLCLDLKWKAQLAYMDRIVNRVRRGVLVNQLDLVMAADAVNCYLIPKLSIHFQALRVPEGKCKEWDKLLRSTALKVAGVRLGSNLNVGAFHTVSGMWSIAEMQDVIQGSELVVRLNSRQRIVAQSAWARLAVGSGPPIVISQLEPERADSNILQALARREDVENKLNRTLNAAGRLSRTCSLDVSEDPWYRCPVLWGETSRSWNVSELPAMYWPYDNPFTLPGATGAPEAIVAFTDGSTPTDGGGNSGFSVVVPRSGGAPPVVIIGPFKANGNNFLAEAAAFLALLCLAPENVTLRFVTDSMAAMGSCLRDWKFVTDRQRITAAGRPLINTIRRLIGARSGGVFFEHVRAHTRDQSHRSRMNAAADKHANVARIAAEGLVLPEFLWGEERVVVRTVEGAHVIGNVRHELMKRMAAKHVDVWVEKGEGHQGRVVQANRSGVLSTCEVVRKEGDPLLLQFFLQAVTEWLPTDHRLHYTGHDTPLNACKLCGARDTVRHLFRCQATRGVVEDTIRAVERELTDDRTRGWSPVTIGLVPGVFEQRLGEKLKFLARGWPAGDVAGSVASLYVKRCSTRGLAMAIGPALDCVRVALRAVGDGASRVVMSTILKEILCGGFGLTGDWLATAFDVCAGCLTWVSAEGSDAAFGAMHPLDPFRIPPGRWLLNLCQIPARDVPAVLDAIRTSLRAPEPITHVVVLPAGAVGDPPLGTLLALFPADTLPVLSWSSDQQCWVPGVEPERIMVVVVQNELARLSGSVHWERVLTALGTWQRIFCSMCIVLRSDFPKYCPHEAKCDESLPPKGVNAPIVRHVLQWCDPFSPPTTCHDGTILRLLTPSKAAALLKARKFDRFAGVLGILPVGLMSLLSWRFEHGSWCSVPEVDRLLGRVRRVLLYGALGVWNYRNSLYGDWWKDERFFDVQCQVAERAVDARVVRKRKSAARAAEQFQQKIARTRKRRRLKQDTNQPSPPSEETPWVSDGRNSRLDTSYTRGVASGSDVAHHMRLRSVKRKFMGEDVDGRSREEQVLDYVDTMARR